MAAPPPKPSRARCRYSGFVKSTITGLVTRAFAADSNSRVQVSLVSALFLLLLLGAVVMLARCG